MCNVSGWILLKKFKPDLLLHRIHRTLNVGFIITHQILKFGNWHILSILCSLFFVDLNFSDVCYPWRNSLSSVSVRAGSQSGLFDESYLKKRGQKRLFPHNCTALGCIKRMNIPVRFRSLSVFRTPSCVRKTPSRGSRMFTLSAKSPPPKVPQPERLDEVYEALKRGLQ